jgi:tripartite-type tricarboxylate transporter receptor subunit TctC
MMKSSRLLKGLGSLILFGFVTGHASAQSYPDHPIRLIASAAPGGSTDLLARVLAEKLTGSLGQPVVVENRPGASGDIAAGVVAKARPDGYTLMIVASSFTTNISLRPHLSYDPLKDFAPVTQLVNNTFVLAIPENSKANTFAEFIAEARSKHGGINYSSAGIGEGNHLGMEWLKKLAGFNATHVPFAGTGPSATALLTGTVDVSLLTLPAALPYVKAHRMKALAVTGLKRSPQLPSVPTIAELGYPTYILEGWQGLLAPAGTPKDIVDRLFQETQKALRQPDIERKLAGFDLDPVGSSPAQFSTFLKSDITKWGGLIKESGAQLN